ncbi:hypothetical protein N7462_009986 [Penicillium macrosclerotiorum]|uniref:uncharacterized protein n=1 Tax=Penicillium macrosclerotiorum TaxID=303699 RepID=UPI002548100E|nr:uncharacterized protein N7462_009986 [Penicillium macrosclerotiorum]KAJ5668916.1 hypothetical protein N7462_009986 [Penicillium macrosclerotiorum]
MATAIKHVKLLTDLGNLPYALARPILLKVDNPERLHSMEKRSPQIAEEDQEIWLEIIKRDIPQWDTYDLPEKSNRWYEIYCDLREEVERSLDADAAKMKLAIDGITSQKAKLAPKVLPGLRRQKPSFRQRIMSTHVPKKSTIFTPQRRNNHLAVPTKHLATRASQIRQAPRSLIEEHRRPVEPPAARRPNDPSAQIPGPGPSMRNPLSGSSSLADREARLRALTSGNPRTSLSAKDPSSPVKKPVPKRRATSPPLTSPPPPSRSRNDESQAAAQSQAANPADATSPARPSIKRRKPDVDIFLRPKQRKRVP